MNAWAIKGEFTGIFSVDVRVVVTIIDKNKATIHDYARHGLISKVNLLL